MTDKRVISQSGLSHGSGIVQSSFIISHGCFSLYRQSRFLRDQRPWRNFIKCGTVCLLVYEMPSQNSKWKKKTSDHKYWWLTDKHPEAARISMKGSAHFADCVLIVTPRNSGTSHNLNYCYRILNHKNRNVFSSNLIQRSSTSIEEHALINIVCEKAIFATRLC